MWKGEHTLTTRAGVTEVQEQLIADFTELGDSFNQYAYLLELSVQLETMNSDLKTEARLVAGCQSKVWLALDFKEGRIGIKADSDTLIIRGILAILLALWDNRTPREIVATELCLFEKTAITETFSSQRVAGIGQVIKTIRDFAGTFLTD